MSDETPRASAPEQDQSLDSADAAETTKDTVATPETDGARVAEAGHGYVGRQMDDALKTNPRVLDGDEAVDETPSTPGDE